MMDVVLGGFINFLLDHSWDSIQQKVGMEEFVAIECLIGWGTKNMHLEAFHL